MSIIPLSEIVISVSPGRMFLIVLKCCRIVAFFLFLGVKVITARYWFDSAKGETFIIVALLGELIENGKIILLVIQDGFGVREGGDPTASAGPR